MNYKIVATETFQREAKILSKKYHSLKDDLASFRENLLKNPFIGVDLGNNSRKIRIAITSKNKGKRGGARIIIYNLIVNIDETKVYLLSIYDKGEKDSISKQEIEDLKKQNSLM
jgi:hypothetical protein